jgi:hypothetical protein
MMTMEKRRLKIEQVEQAKTLLSRIADKRRKTLEKKFRTAGEDLERRKENRDIGIEIKKEIKNLKISETRENAFIAKNVRAY